MPDVNLQQLLTEYENNLCNKLFKYELSNHQIVEVIFYKEQFCHLLGLQYIYNHDKHYLGENGYNKIKNGTITTELIVAHNKKKYNYIKDRLQHFYEIAELMSNGQLVRFYRDRTKPPTQITAEYIIIKDKKTYTLHLFLRKETLVGTGSQYAPVSFIIKSENDKTKRQYIDLQEFKTISSLQIISLNQA